MTILILAAVGLTFIITDSKICKKYREWVSGKKDIPLWNNVNEVINCPQCCGVWAGLIMALLVGGLYITLPLATSFIAYFFNKVILYLNRH
jgi:hypothetical protein